MDDRLAGLLRSCSFLVQMSWWYLCLHFGSFFLQHNRFVLDCKDKEPDVLFVGDSMVQLLQQYEVLRGREQTEATEA